jgi:hypothetical protein
VLGLVVDEEWDEKMSSGFERCFYDSGLEGQGPGWSFSIFCSSKHGQYMNSIRISFFQCKARILNFWFQGNLPLHLYDYLRTNSHNDDYIWPSGRLGFFDFSQTYRLHYP